MNHEGNSTGRLADSGALAFPDVVDESATVKTSQRSQLKRTGWLHFYQMRHLDRASQMPSIISRGEGIYVFDDGGKRYIDGLSGAFCVNVGYGRESILAQMQKAASSIHFVSPFLALTPTSIALSERLSSLATPALGPDARVFFLNSGSEAVEAAIKIARSYASRSGKASREIWSRTHSYHGTTLGALSVSGLDTIQHDFHPLAPGFAKVPYPNCKRCELGLERGTCELACLDNLKAAMGLQEPPCAVLIETIQTSGGLTLPPAGYLDLLQSFCGISGALLIVDEVITGFGRTGHWFSCGAFNLNADILVCAKGLTSGYDSLGAVIVKKRVAQIFDGDSDQSCFAHGATFGGRPAAAAAALENLRILESEGLLKNAAEQGDYLTRTLESALKGSSHVGQIYGKGLLLAMDLLDDHGKLAEAGDPRHVALTEALFRNGLILRMFNSRSAPFLQVAPPLCITQTECDVLSGLIAKSINEVYGS